VGTGGGITDTIRILSTGFQLYQLTTIEEARELIVNVVNTCLEEINTHPEWTPYFMEYPISVNTLEIQIWIHRSDYSSFSIGTVRYLSMRNGKWHYALMIPEESVDEYSPNETYEEAMTILYAQGREPITQ